MSVPFTKSISFVFFRQSLRLAAAPRGMPAISGRYPVLRAGAARRVFRLLYLIVVYSSIKIKLVYIHTTGNRNLINHAVIRNAGPPLTRYKFEFSVCFTSFSCFLTTSSFITFRRALIFTRLLHNETALEHVRSGIHCTLPSA